MGLPALLLAVLALVLAACGGGEGPPATPTATLTVVAETPTPSVTSTPAPTPSPTPDLSHGGIALIEQAYKHLLDNYVEPLEPSTVLWAAWHGASEELGQQGFSVSAEPALGGDREAAWRAFRAAYVEAAEAFPDADFTEVRYAALKGMTESVGDCHTFFLPPVQAEALSETQTGKGTVGIGVELGPGPPVWIREVLSGGPAKEAGLRSGDRIMSIDGEDVSTYTFQEVDERLRGEEGTSVSVTVSRPPGGEQVSVEMVRDLVRPPSVEGEVLADGIGYLRIRAFVLGGVSEEVDEELRAFERAGVRGWIIDIRDNPGGFLDVPSISRFVREGVVARSVRRGGEETTAEADGSFFEPGRPIALLLNGGTGSVAEVFAAALQDYDVAYLMGTTSRGCAGYTAIEGLPDGSSVGVTTGQNLSPLGGQPLNEPGVVPDEWVGRTVEEIAEGRDPALERAIAYLRGVLGG